MRPCPALLMVHTGTPLPKPMRACGCGLCEAALLLAVLARTGRAPLSAAPTCGAHEQQLLALRVVQQRDACGVHPTV